MFFVVFFPSLSPILMQPFVICVVAGKPNSIAGREEYYELDPSSIIFLDVYPFSKKDVKAFIQTTTYDDESILKLLFPIHPKGPDWFFKQIYDCTSDIPTCVVHGVRELASSCAELKEFSNLSQDEMKQRLEKIGLNVCLPSQMTPRGMTTFCAMLLSSIFKLPIPIRNTLCRDLDISVGSKYVLDIASHFGFYHVKCSVEELCEADTWISSESIVNLIFPRVAWRQIGKEYCRYTPVRFFPVCLNPLVVTNTCLRFITIRSFLLCLDLSFMFGGMFVSGWEICVYSVKVCWKVCQWKVVKA